MTSTMFTRWKTYLTVYTHLLSFTLKTVMEYRLSFATRFLYAPAYTGVLFTLVWIAFRHAPIISGWTTTEGLLLSATMQCMISLMLFMFIKGIRNFLWFDIRMGMVDLYLVKPINAQFMITLSQPDIDVILVAIGMGGIALWFAAQLASLITLASIFWCVIGLILGLVIGYFTITTYATIGFYVTKAQQVIEFYDKASDFGQYPLTIFAGSIQLAAFTIVPAAYFSYVPVSILLQKLSPTILIIPLLWCFFLIPFNQWCWRTALKRYSSASS